jgi:hypothetical protein
MPRGQGEVPGGFDARGEGIPSSVYRGRSLLFVAYIVVGVLVAAGVIGNDNYFSGLNTLKELADAVLAILLWPLVLLGVNFNIGGGHGGSSGGAGGGSG